MDLVPRAHAPSMRHGPLNLNEEHSREHKTEVDINQRNGEGKSDIWWLRRKDRSN
jgi:hypothetical protein